MNTFRIFTVIIFLIVGQLIFPEHCHAKPYQNLALLQSVGASSSALISPPAYVVDGDDRTFWKSAEGDENPWVVVYLKSDFIIDHVVLPYFSGFEEIRIEVFADSTWREVFKGKSYQQVLFGFEPVDPGHSEGWVTFNTPWNITLAFLSAHETNLEVFDRSFIKPVQTISLGNKDRQIGIRLQAPLNFNYSKVESGEVRIQTSRGDSYRMTVYEKIPDDMAFTGLINFDEGRVDTGDNVLQVRPGDTITVSYGYDFLKKSVTIEVIK